MHQLTDQLLTLARTFGAATDTRRREGGVSLSGISTKIFNDGKTLDRVANGGDLTTGSFERAMRWFSANWPENTPWPDGIARPEPVSSAESAA
jgi:hypothetical protein